LEIVYSYNDKSLERHGVSYSDVDEVLDRNNISRRDFDMSLSRCDNLRVMFVGCNLAGRLLEVGVEFIDEGNACVFHGQTVSPRYRKFYEEGITSE
jgi:hypothetical protein